MSSDDSLYGQRGAFPIPSDVALGDLDQEPESGEQYLLRVMTEAAAAPSFVAASRIAKSVQKADILVKTDYQPDNVVLVDAVIPSEQWCQQFAKSLKQDRSRFKQIIRQTRLPEDFALPEAGNSKAWRSFCYETCSSSSPNDRRVLLSLAAMDQTMAIRLIKWMTTWLTSDRLWRAEGVWLWCLILKLDELLDQDDMHALRELCRRLKKIRESISLTIGHNVTDQAVHRSEEIAALNILIISVTRGYGQLDMEK
ncbi:gem (nuclear organelle) associated protein 2 [Coemansia sp. RSA 1286]|nr:gem (nuclear organelle) associated protein 2 [Coemansia sp. RSA 1286]